MCSYSSTGKLAATHPARPLVPATEQDHSPALGEVSPKAAPVPCKYPTMKSHRNNYRCSSFPTGNYLQTGGKHHQHHYTNGDAAWHDKRRYKKFAYRFRLL